MPPSVLLLETDDGSESQVPGSSPEVASLKKSPISTVFLALPISSHTSKAGEVQPLPGFSG